MSVKTDLPEREVTPRPVYELARRTFLKAGVLGASVLATAAAYRRLLTPYRKGRMGVPIPNVVKAPPPASPAAPAAYAPPDEPLTPYEHVTGYNNFYEFSTDKREVAFAARNFVTAPWQLVVDGECQAPRSFGLEDVLALAPPEERIYRHRCVEGWSMVIPWVGFPLAKLLDAVRPTSNAKFVAFETLLDPKRMPNQDSGVLDWPYREGLRLDEAMHPLTLLASGLYGETLPPQNGAPLRLVVPWKYGFKSAKSIVRVSLVRDLPPTTWNAYAPNEYGFYSNVNPDVAHPRWSQAKERRIGEVGKRDTLLFNGYADQVASLYAGLDLKENF